MTPPRRTRSARLVAAAVSPDGAALPAELLQRIRDIWERSRAQAARPVNTAHVCANWLIGQIVQAEQGGATRASYGQALLKKLAERLGAEYGSGFSLTALKHMRGFYLAYPQLLQKGQALGDLLAPEPDAPTPPAKGHALRDLLGAAARAQGAATDGAAWQPGQLHPGLSWTHYRALLKVKREDARHFFYEIEAVKNAWSARQPERQINSLLFERLAKSRDKPGVLALAREGHEPVQPADLIKDPYVLEFLQLPEVPPDQEMLAEGDNPSIGLILCTEKNDAVVRYVLAERSRQIFASRYQLYLPTEAQLQDELRRELARVESPAATTTPPEEEQA